MKKYLNTSAAPAAVGPYSQALKINGVIYTSGQLPINSKTGEMPETVKEQTRQSLKNVEAILVEGGSDLNNVIKTTVFMTDLNYFNEMNEVYASFFKEGAYPARSCFQVSKLPKDAKVEIEVIAIEKED